MTVAAPGDPLARYRDVPVHVAIGLQEIRVADLEAALDRMLAGGAFDVAGLLAYGTIPEARRRLNALRKQAAICGPEASS